VTLSPRNVRKDLFKASYDQDRFIINETDDACEALEAILACLHKGARIPVKKGVTLKND
jgi:hypothetical protein